MLFRSAAPSANRFGRVSPTTAAHVRADLGDEVDLVLEGGDAEVGIESTIVDLSRGAPVLLRDVARVELVPDERRGLSELNGEGNAGDRRIVLVERGLEADVDELYNDTDMASVGDSDVA